MPKDKKPPGWRDPYKNPAKRKKASPSDVSDAGYQAAKRVGRKPSPAQDAAHAKYQSQYRKKHGR